MGDTTQKDDIARLVAEHPNGIPEGPAAIHFCPVPGCLDIWESEATCEHAALIPGDPGQDQAFIVWLVETLHYPFDMTFSTPPPVDHDRLADHWNEWDGWNITAPEARACVREEAGLHD